MKVLVTGSTGFVGSNLCRHLKEKGHEVYALARSESKFKKHQVQGKLVLGDLDNYPLSWVSQLPSDLNAVIHVAGLVASFDNDDFHKVNVLGTKNLVSALKPNFPKLKFILISSLAASGPSQLVKKTEENPCYPVSAYGKSKLEGEKVLQNIAPEEWTKVIIRPPIILGPGDTGFLEVFKMVKKGYYLCVGDPEKKTYSFIGVGDLVQAITSALETPLSSERTHVFFTCFPKEITFTRLVESISDKMNKNKVRKIALPVGALSPLAQGLRLASRVLPVKTKITPDKINELLPDRWTCSSRKSIDILNVSYQWDLDITVKRTYDDYCKRGWL